MEASSRRLRSGDRLRRPQEFRRLSAAGRRRSGPNFVVLSAARGRDEGRQGCRLGLTVSRKVGGAVVRNRVKRRVREWFRNTRGSIGEGIDFVVIARAGAAGLAYRALTDELDGLVRRADDRRG